MLQVEFFGAENGQKSLRQWMKDYSTLGFTERQEKVRDQCSETKTLLLSSVLYLFCAY